MPVILKTDRKMQIPGPVVFENSALSKPCVSLSDVCLRSIDVHCNCMPQTNISGVRNGSSGCRDWLSFVILKNWPLCEAVATLSKVMM